MSGMGQTESGTGNMNRVGYGTNCGGYGKQTVSGMRQSVEGMGNMNSVGYGINCGGYGKHEQCLYGTSCGGYGKHEQSRVWDKLWRVRET